MANPAQKMKYVLQRRDQEKRRRLVLLVRILTRYLEQRGKTDLLNEVREVVRDCNHEFCMGGGDPSWPLHAIIESRLEQTVDTDTWMQVIVSLELYLTHRLIRCQQNRIKLAMASSNNGQNPPVSLAAAADPSPPSHTKECPGEVPV